MTDKSSVDQSNLNTTEPSIHQLPRDHIKVTPVDDESKCPVDHSNYKFFLPETHKQQVEVQQGEASKCPVSPDSYQHFISNNDTKAINKDTNTNTNDNDNKINTTTATPTEGCTSDSIDTSNYMPHISQQPLPDQKGHLGKHREISTIPRANSEEKLWVYPSEQMFFNAMRRKNWTPREEDMPVVVPIHNAVNEEAWIRILEWEKLHKTECNQPKLLKFQGRPKDITPKARIRSWFGYELPFDRHDWTVDRCGEKVTYVIDFYAGKQDPKRPGVSFYLDVRPAVSFGGIFDRIKMSWQKGEFL